MWNYRKVFFEKPPSLQLLFLANTLDHFETALYLLLANVMAKDLLATYCQNALMAWSISLPLASCAKLLSGLFWTRLQSILGTLLVLKIALFGVCLCCLMLGALGALKVYYSLVPPAYCLVILILIKSVQSFFSSAQTQACSCLMIEHSPKEQTVFRSALANASGVLGLFLASCSIYALSFLDDAVRHWPIVYLFAGSLGLWFSHKRLSMLTSRAQEQAYSISRAFKTLELIPCSLLQAISYSTYYLVWIFYTQRPELNFQMNALYQLQLSFTDLMLIGPCALFARFLSPSYWLFFCSCSLAGIWACYSLSLCTLTCCCWLTMVFGVGISVCTTAYIHDVCNPRTYFATLMLSTSFGSLIAGIALYLALLAKSNMFCLFIQHLPFMALLALYVTCSFVYGRTYPLQAKV